MREDGNRSTIYPADVKGRFQRRKNVVWAILIAIYLVLPWVKIGGRPAILIDIAARDFFLFGSVFNAQDFYLAFFVLTGIGFTLFVVSALYGRVWCGYACPHTVFLEGVFRRIERWLEGSARKRKQLADAPMSRRKLVLRVTKWAVYAVISLVLSHTMLGFFMPIEDVLRATTHSPAENWTAFVFVAVFTLIIYANFTWFREQLCIVICPYGRLQGVLYDRDTKQVGYDRVRGEPRGKAVGGAGDCVDCYRCVAVCPTGIDIRNGTQLECVGCFNCIDACDEVMLKVGKPVGLVRYDSQNGLEGQTRRFARPRLFLYGFLFVLGVTVFALVAMRRTDFEVDLIRRVGTAFEQTEDGGIRNTYFLRIDNKRDETVEFIVDAVGPPGSDIFPARLELAVPARSFQRVPVMVTVDKAAFDPALRLTYRVWSQHMADDVTVSAPMLGPRR